MVDFCATCAEKAVSFVATTFAMPQAPKPAVQKVRLANGGNRYAANICTASAGRDRLINHLIIREFYESTPIET
jgi:hypothetical protein